MGGYGVKSVGKVRVERTTMVPGSTVGRGASAVVLAACHQYNIQSTARGLMRLTDRAALVYPTTNGLAIDCNKGSTAVAGRTAMV